MSLLITRYATSDRQKAVERLAGRAANTYVLTLDSPRESGRRLQVEIESNRNVKLLYRRSIQVAN